MLEPILAGGGLAVCALLLLRLGVGERRRRAIDRAFDQAWRGLLRSARRGRDRLQALRRRQPAPANAEARATEAAAAAEALIRRARRGGARSSGREADLKADREADREGNVIRPHAFRASPPSPERGRDPDPPRTLH